MRVAKQIRKKYQVIISFSQLQQAFASGGKLPPPARVREILRSNKIKFFKDTQNRPWTTQSAMDYAMGISQQSTADDDYPEIVIE